MVCTVLLAVDISKSLESKRKRLETFTQASVRASNKKVEEVWQKQQKERYIDGSHNNIMHINFS